MGWFGGWFGGADSSDPLRKLDPKLREFLDKEAPTKYTPEADKTPKPEPPSPAAPPAKTKTPNTSSAADAPAVAAAAENEKKTAKLPSESLYQDGRYAHLWKNYRPLADIENETKSDHEKMTDLLEEYKARRSAIGRTALENCAEEQADWAGCMTNGSAGDRFVMCRDQVRKFERCYMMQSKLLKALGYLSTGTQRTAEEDERIQMHADTLYHRMLEREAATENAKAEGTPVPTFGPLVTAVPASSAAAESASLAAVADATRAQVGTPAPAKPEEDILAKYLAHSDRKKKWDEQMAKLPPGEQHAEEEAMRAELRATTEVRARIDTMWDARKEERRERLQKGQGTVTDRVAEIFGKA